MKLSDFIREMVKPVTRNIELVAEVARQYGLPFPKTYQVGIAPSTYYRHGTTGDLIAVLRVRIDNVNTLHDVVVPEDSRPATVETFIERLRTVATDTVAEFIKNSDEKAEFEDKIEEFVNGLTSDTDERWSEIAEIAKSAARTATYIEHKPGRSS